MIATLLTLCPPVGERVTCAVDGDTWWLSGVKVRAVDFDTPELNGKCQAERALAIRARDRALELLNSGKVTYTTHGYDRMKKPRLLVKLYVDGEPLADQLVGEGLARRWGGRRLPWC